MHGGTLLLGVLFTLQLLVSAGQLINQWVLLEQKVPEAHRMHAKALNDKQVLQRNLAKLTQASGLEKIAREQLDYAAPGETLVRLY